jgi:hypothetical protein
MQRSRTQSRELAEELALAHVKDPLPAAELRITAVLVRMLLPLAGAARRMVSAQQEVHGHWLSSARSGSYG